MKHEILLESELEQAFPYEELLKTCIETALAEEGVDVPCEVAVAHYKRQEKYYSHLR